MAGIRVQQQSFNAGELTPLLNARYGVEKVQAGCRKLRNFIPHVHGPVFRRPGMEFMGSAAAHDSASRLVSFNFSTTTTFVLELHPSGLRVWSNGLLVPLVAPVAWPYTVEESKGLQYVQVNDVCWLVHPSHPVRQLTRHADDDWRLTVAAWVWPALRDENTGATTVAASVATGAGTLAASAALFEPGHVGSFWQVSHRRDTAYTEIKQGATVDTWNGTAERVSPELRVVGRYEIFTYGMWEARLYLETKGADGVWSVVRTWAVNKDRNIVVQGTVDAESMMRLRVSTGSLSVSTADVRFLLECSDARVYGLVKITGVTSPTVANMEVVMPLHSTAATVLWTEGAWSEHRGYPRAIALHGPRLWLAATRADQRRTWYSALNDFVDFRRSSLDSGSGSLTLGQGSSEVQWMVSQGNVMLLGTAEDEWTVGSKGGIVTPTDYQFDRQSRYGSEWLPAQLVNEVAVFIQRGGRRLRKVSPRSDSDAWAAADLTVLAEHVTGAGIRQTAFASNPGSILWAVTNDGKLIGMTFEQEQNVFAWHVHETAGLVESVAVIYGAEADEVWLSVKRGARRNIERMSPQAMARRFTPRETLVYLDAAVTREHSSPVATISGLEHLEGQEVAILGDAAEQPRRRVIGGGITLATPAAVVVIGLPYTSALQPMRFDLPMDGGTAQHRNWRVSRVGLDLLDSLGGEVADGPGARPERLNYRQSGNMPMSSAPPLYTGPMELPIESITRAGVDVIISTSDPLPFGLASLTLALDIYGE